ncbi:MAG: hypothetical protein ABI398_07810 [Devosia sp.]
MFDTQPGDVDLAPAILRQNRSDDIDADRLPGESFERRQAGAKYLVILSYCRNRWSDKPAEILRPRAVAALPPSGVSNEAAVSVAVTRRPRSEL